MDELILFELMYLSISNTNDQTQKIRMSVTNIGFKIVCNIFDKNSFRVIYKHYSNGRNLVIHLKVDQQIIFI